MRPSGSIRTVGLLVTYVCWLMVWGVINHVAR
jgi:hypothetical protein